MSVRMQLYQYLVNRDPAIRKKYHGMREQDPTKTGRVKAWVFLVLWNFGFSGQRKEEQKYRFGSGISGMASERWISPQKMAEQLVDADIISFDVFDTLVLRPFAKPEDLFWLVGLKLNVPGFQKKRMDAEEKVRIRALEEGRGEIGIDEIYEYMEQEYGICAAEGKTLETDTELALCMPNPYMHQVYEYLLMRGKELIAVSDMYLSGNVVQKILQQCGFEKLQLCFVSSEYGVTKSTGKLYQVVQKKLEEEKKKSVKILQIGDNVASDWKSAPKSGWEAVKYQQKTVGQGMMGCEEMSPVIRSVYIGIVNARIFHKTCSHMEDYEMGYCLGGLLAVGYCQFIHEHMGKECDRILFFSRDGDILYQVYGMLYPQECEEKAIYAYWSRLAALKLTAEYYKQEYFRRFLEHKAGKGYSLREILYSMELEDMQKEAEAYLKKRDGKEEICLTAENVKPLKCFLKENWLQVLSHYEKENEAARQYYKELLENCRNVYTVDIGWVGSGSVMLDHLLNRKWKIGCNITGFIAGTDTGFHTEEESTEILLRAGKLKSYFFSSEKNRDLWKAHNPDRGDNIICEILCSSPTGSLREFVLDEEGKAVPVLGKAEETTIIRSRQIQKGILDFVQDFIKMQEKGIPLEKISGADAYCNIAWLCRQRDVKKYIESWHLTDIDVN